MAFDPDKLIDGAAAAIDLPIAPAHRDGVGRFLRIAAEMAKTVDAAPVPEKTLDLATVFTPITPPEDAP
ncbi:MAG: DUF4089 domain-containing protein [Pseudomonadota bacterium]